jgi:alanine dehydrogenase
MRIGVPKEIKTEENRVGLTPTGVKSLAEHGHRILIETMAGVGSGFFDSDYEAAGATILPDAKTLYTQADLIVKIKEPLESEYALLSPGQLLFTYLHLAANEALTRALLASGVRAFAYESLELPDGRLPLLEPMSEIAGKIAAQAGANLLSHAAGGSGVLLAGATGVRRGKVVILGAGIVGKNAARIASGLGADVVVMDIDSARLAEIGHTMDKNVSTLYSNPANIREILPEADLVIGAILQKDSRTPRVITESMIQSMKQGSVFVDVSIDQGGCAETSRPTTHKEPTFVKHGVIHYCVANMPGAFAKTATLALTGNTLPYVILLADRGFEEALFASVPMQKALNLADGRLYNRAIAETFGLDVFPLSEWTPVI